MTFLADFRAGRVDAEQIGTYVALWHEAPIGSPAAQVDLHEYLGMTWEQYGRWVTTGELPAIRGLTAWEPSVQTGCTPT